MRNRLINLIAIAVLIIVGTIVAVAAGTSDRPADQRLALALTAVLGFAYVGLVVTYFLQRQPATGTQATKTPITTPAATPEATPRATTKPDAYYDFKGDVHDVIDVEGIGPKYAEQLQAIGIQTTARLCYEDAEGIAKAIDAPVKTVRKWQAMSQLAKVNGIGKQYAEVLVRAGVEDIDSLKKGDPERIAKQVNAYLEGLENNVLGQKVTPKRIQGWQTKAKPMRRVRQGIPTA